MLSLDAPTPLTDGHGLDDFECSVPELNFWLQERARQNQASGACRCFVVCDQRKQVIAYYALAAGSVSHEIATTRLRRNMPNPLPVVVLELARSAS